MADSELNVPVLVSIVTFNDEAFLRSCLESVLAQNIPVRVKVFDNASRDGTCRIAREFPVELIESHQNLGYSGGHNRNLLGEEYQAVLLLNADVVLRCDYLEKLCPVLEQVDRAGMAGGKLLRMDARCRRVLRRGHPLIDSAGMYFTPSQRHFDRGSQQEDTGQFDQRQLVFGITGAALLCKREMVEDVTLDGEFLDEDFFAYREDADLAWRAQLRGWRAVYDPAAQACHCRKVLPSRRRLVSRLANLHSVKNRFLMRAKNMDSAVRRKCFPYMYLRDLAVVVYVLLLEWGSIPAFSKVWRLRKKYREKRSLVQSTRRVPPEEIARWFSFKPQARDL